MPSPAASSERSSAGDRAATASTALERSISARLASSARAAARTTSGRPAPDSTASVIASRAARSNPASARVAGTGLDRPLDAVPEPGDGQAAGDAQPDERGGHVERQEQRADP